jgi:hypothetical protein
MVKDMTPDEQRIESDKHAGRHEAIKSRQQAARLDKERRQETERYLVVQAMGNNEELASKADRTCHHADEAGGPQRRVWRHCFYASFWTYYKILPYFAYLG